MSNYYLDYYRQYYYSKPPFIRNYNDKWIEFNYTYTYEYYE
ncbi:MAG: hypothetical protein R2801_02135 [Chitinophagales bacterium]